MTTQTTDSPRSLGRYELVQLLGQGGMGEVYLAKISGAAGFEKPCIVKTILPALLKDGQFLDRFHHEAKVLVHLVHSCIAQVYDMGETHGTYYMALEYVAGVDVDYLAEQARVRGKPIPVPVALYIGQKVAEGLGYAHRKTGPDGTPLGIVHRDVSPQNVMVSYEGEVKVIDFGLAKSAARSKHTQPSTVMGKLGYMSPEQVRAEPLDHRSDIYSCGVMVWELLTGQPLVAHGTMGEMMAAMANPRVPLIHELRPEVAPAIDAVVRRALAPNPQDRYSRADEFARALNEQLLRASTVMGAEEVGDFVKELCPEAFAQQRTLISSISSGRRAPSTPPAHGGGMHGVASPLPRGVDPRVGLEATAVRSSQGMEEVGLAATLRPMMTPLPGALATRDAPSATLMAAQQGSPLAPAQSGVVLPSSGLTYSKLAGFTVLVFAVIVCAVIAVFLLLPILGIRPPPPDGEHPGPPPDQWVGPPPHGNPPYPPDPFHRPPPPPHEGWRGPDGRERGPHDGPPGPHDGPPGPEGNGPDGPHGEGPHGEGPHGEGPQGAEGFAEPASNVISASGTADSIAAVPAVATVTEPSTEPGPRPRPGVNRPKKRLAMREGRGESEPMTEAQELDAASSLAPAAEPAPPPPPERRQLNVSVRRSSPLPGINGFIIHNEGREALTQCEITLIGKRRGEIKILRTGDTSVKGGELRWNLSAPSVPKSHMFIECAEGSALVGIH